MQPTLHSSNFLSLVKKKTWNCSHSHDDNVDDCDDDDEVDDASTTQDISFETWQLRNKNSLKIH